MEPSRAVVRSRHHVRAGGRLGRDRRLRGAGRRCHRQGEPQPEPPRWVHWSHSANASTPPPDRSTTVTPRRARPSCRNSTLMNPLALRAKRVLSSAVTRSRWPNVPAPLTSSRSEEHTSELQSLAYLVCRLLLEKKKKKKTHREYDKEDTI